MSRTVITGFAPYNLSDSLVRGPGGVFSGNETVPQYRRSIPGKRKLA